MLDRSATRSDMPCSSLTCFRSQKLLGALVAVSPRSLDARDRWPDDEEVEDDPPDHADGDEDQDDRVDVRLDTGEERQGESDDDRHQAKDPFARSAHSLGLPGHRRAQPGVSDGGESSIGSGATDLGRPRFGDWPPCRSR